MNASWLAHSAAAVVVAGASAVLLSAGPAAASCALVSAEEWVASGEPLLLGRTMEERNGFIKVAVDEVWSGPDLAPEVWLRAGSQSSTSSTGGTTADYGLTVGRDYLISYSADYRASLCSAVEVEADITAARPPQARPPTEGAATGARPTPEPPQNPSVPSAAVLGGGALVISSLWWLNRRHNPKT